MGLAKRTLERLEDLVETARMILVEVGAAEWADDGTFLSTENDEALSQARKLAWWRVKRGEIDATNAEIQQAITTAMEAAEF